MTIKESNIRLTCY